MKKCLLGILTLSSISAFATPYQGVDIGEDIILRPTNQQMERCVVDKSQSQSQYCMDLKTSFVQEYAKHIIYFEHIKKIDPDFQRIFDNILRKNAKILDDK